MTKTMEQFLFVGVLTCLLFAGPSFFPPTDGSFSGAVWAQDEEEEEEEEGDDDDVGGDDDIFDDEEEEDEEVLASLPIPKAVRVTGKSLQTDAPDNLILTATYLPGNRGKKTVPIILLHDFGGSRSDLAVLAKTLQKEGYAVLVPDLRGHGGSTKIEIGPEKYEELAYKKLDKSFFMDMLQFDLPALKKFLRKENNKGTLNIDKLCICGVGAGGMLAAYYAPADWDPMVKRKKANPRMGDVKSFIMISPPKVCAGFKFQGALINPNWNMYLSCLILSGGDGSREVDRPRVLEVQIGKRCSKELVQKQVFAIQLDDQSAQGIDLVAEEDSEAVTTILEFLAEQKKRDFVWARR